MPLTLKMTWRTQKDSQVCPICRELEGYTWFLEAGDSYPAQLIHPLYGPVYDLRPTAQCGLVQEKKGHTCRCIIKYEFCLFNIVNKNDSGLAKMVDKLSTEKLIEQE